ncbi:hypothetical protein GJS41_08390 [Kangiella sp. HZ709]|nr:nuclear transport factor 2 family protein [Kangiella sp. HZ709]MRX28165.1 hypothetical protein [Kangiella sp. HZ709]
MKIKSIITATALVICSSCSTNNTNEVTAMELSNKDKAVALLQSIETGDKTPVSYVNPKSYTQHNLAVADGLAGFGEVLQALPKGSAKANVVRNFQDGNYVFTHTDYNFFGPKVGFDVFRFEDGLIVEHWDNLAEKATSPNPSGRTQLDGSVELTDLDKTQENKALVSDFIDTILINGQFDKLTNYINSETYIQHNTSVADGLDGLAQAIEAMAKQGIQMIYTSNHAVLGQGNFVLTISEGTFANQHVSYYDLFRVSEGKIVEHWDVIEPIAAKDTWKNNNGKFNFKHDYIVEVATFKLKDGVSPKDFNTLDQQVEIGHVSQQPGFISRESGLTEDNYWRVIVHWDSLNDADASMNSFMAAPAAAAFMDAVDTSTMIMRRYKHLSQ